MTCGGPAIGDRASGACGHTSQGDGGGSAIVWRGVGRIGVRRVVGDLNSHSEDYKQNRHHAVVGTIVICMQTHEV